MQEHDSAIFRFAEFVVDKRKAFFVLFLVGMVYCIINISRVEVENDLTVYLSEDTETRQGVDIMDNEFSTFGSAKILLANITYERALAVAKGLEEIDGISRVRFYDPEDSDYRDKEITDYYKDSAALITLSFEEEKETELSQKAIAEVREYVKDYDNYVYTLVDQDDSADLMKEVKTVLVMAVFVILGVLIFTSETFAEVPVFLVTFVVAAILNKGTNFLFGKISFISNAVDVVLQLGLAIDYAIILFHRYMEEKDKGYTAHDAMVYSLGKAILEISSSSLTTMAGLFALVFMHYQIGRDIGLVLCKSILFSMLTVFFFMPFLIMTFKDNIEKTRHRNFIPKISAWGRFIFRTRHLLPLAFALLLFFAFRWSSQCPYIFDKYSAASSRTTEYIRARNRINETFDTGTTMAVVLPRKDYSTEAEVVRDLESLDYVSDVTGLANVAVGDAGEYVLTDDLTPREFAEVADLDVGISRLLYGAYAEEKGAYGAFVDGIDEYRIPVIDLVDFIYDEKEKGAFSLSAKQSEDITDIHEDISDARKQLESEQHSRIIFTLAGESEGAEAFARVDAVRGLVQSHYKDRIYVAGDVTGNKDLSATFGMDNFLISGLTALFVGLILLFTFQSASLPFILLLTIQGSIWINFSLPYLVESPIFFLAYLIVSAIQMGATIDYAIVITNRYMTLRTQVPDRQQAVVQSLNEVFPTIITSGTILASCGFLINFFTSNAVIAQLGRVLGTGVTTSILLVMTVLPQLLYLFDPIFDRTSFKFSPSMDLGAGSALKRQREIVYINGTVKGYFSGYLSGEFHGRMNGDMDLKLTREKGEPEKNPGAGEETLGGGEETLGAGEKTLGGGKAGSGDIPGAGEEVMGAREEIPGAGEKTQAVGRTSGAGKKTLGAGEKALAGGPPEADAGNRSDRNG